MLKCDLHSCYGWIKYCEVHSSNEEKQYIYFSLLLNPEFLKNILTASRFSHYSSLFFFFFLFLILGLKCVFWLLSIWYHKSLNKSSCFIPKAYQKDKNLNINLCQNPQLIKFESIKMASKFYWNSFQTFFKGQNLLLESNNCSGLGFIFSSLRGM